MRKVKKTDTVAKDIALIALGKWEGAIALPRQDRTAESKEGASGLLYTRS